MSDPLSPEDLEKIRERSRPAAAYASLEGLTASADDVPALLAEVDRLHSWDGLMSLLDEHWPENIFPTVEDSGDRDWGPRIVSLLRWVDRSRTELAKERTDSLRLAQEVAVLATAIARVREIPFVKRGDELINQFDGLGWNNAMATVFAALDDKEAGE
jgi:hypothetical protein